VVVNEDPGETVCGPVVPSRTIIPKPGMFSPTEYADNGRTGPAEERNIYLCIVSQLSFPRLHQKASFHGTTLPMSIYYSYFDIYTGLEFISNALFYFLCTSITRFPSSKGLRDQL